MHKIDIHTHILPPQLPDFAKKYGYGEFVTLEYHAPCKARLLTPGGKIFREVENNCFDPHIRLHDCDRQNVCVQVLSTLPVMFNYWVKPGDCLDFARYFNDHIAGVVADHPQRFVGLGTLPLQAPELAVKELERCVKELGLAGVQIGSHVNEWNLSAPQLFPVFQAACELKAAIFVHPWDMMGQEKMSKYWLPWLVGMPAEISLAICSMIFSGVFERLPELRVAFAHGGAAFAATYGRVAQGFKSRPDLCAVDNTVNPRAYLGHFWVDSLVHDARVLKFILDVFGEDKVALGTDYPFPLGEDEPGWLIESIPGLSYATRQKLLFKNALTWLGLTAERFGLEELEVVK